MVHTFIFLTFGDVANAFFPGRDSELTHADLGRKFALRHSAFCQIVKELGDFLRSPMPYLLGLASVT